MGMKLLRAAIVFGSSFYPTSSAGRRNNPATENPEINFLALALSHTFFSEQNPNRWRGNGAKMGVQHDFSPVQPGKVRR